jgi:uncharacterized protein (TIGR02266 family)
MKTVLDLIGEFAALGDAKARSGGTLPPGSERRWNELKSFYDLLMAQNGLTKRPVSKRFTSKDIGKRVKSWDRLRVPVQLEMAVRVGDDYHSIHVINVSRGGVFVSSDRIYPVGTQLILYVANAYGGDEAMFEAESEVVWLSECGIPESGLPRGMGLRFLGDQEAVLHQLDSFVLETLELRLSGLDANALAPEFLFKEDLEL